MNFVKYRKSISVVMIFAMMVFGMCFDLDVESYSFFACENLYVPEIAPISVDFQEGTVLTSNIETSTIRQTYLCESVCEQEIVSGAVRRFERNNVRSMRNNNKVLFLMSSCLFLLLYFMLWEVCPNLHKIYNNIVVVSYIHQQDGQKIYSF